MKEISKKITSICNSILNKESEFLSTSIEKYKIDALNITSESLEYLPHTILCDLAEYLIQLTGLKQKLFSELETVSIETDVELITKSKCFK